jgi:uncharacterized membrane-anchored protein
VKKTWTLGLFGCVALAQLAAPVSMIAKRETTLRTGRQFRFRAAPVDPYDAFRGRYVALRLEASDVVTTSAARFKAHQKVYARIVEEADGFARIAEIAAERPKDGDYIVTRLDYPYGNKVHVPLPFDRYYMNENLAPAAERAYREHSRREARDAYVTVRVRNGFAVLEQLHVAGKPIEQFLREKE